MSNKQIHESFYTKSTTFGEEGYFRVARSTNPPQMGIAGGYFGCWNDDCSV